MVSSNQIGHVIQSVSGTRCLFYDEMGKPIRDVTQTALHPGFCVSMSRSALHTVDTGPAFAASRNLMKLLLANRNGDCVSALAT